MTKLLIMAVCVAGAGALGYFGERLLRPAAAPATLNPFATEKSELLFKLPLGKFTMQIAQKTRKVHIAFEIDVYIMGSSAFQNINGAVGQAKLRDGMVTAIAELAETDPELLEGDNKEANKKALAEKIVRKLYVDFPMVRAARLNRFDVDTTLREPAGY